MLIITHLIFRLCDMIKVDECNLILHYFTKNCQPSIIVTKFEYFFFGKRMKIIKKNVRNKSICRISYPIEFCHIWHEPTQREIVKSGTINVKLFCKYYIILLLAPP